MQWAVMSLQIQQAALAILDDMTCIDGWDARARALAHACIRTRARTHAHTRTHPME